MKYLDNFIIFERLSSVVYHFTGFSNLYNVLKTNEFHASAAFGSSSDFNINKGKFFFFSTTRSKRAGYKGYQVKIVLNGDKLSNKYKGGAVDYWQYSKNPNDWGSPNSYRNMMSSPELEDRIMLDSPTIPNAISYIKEIHVLAKKGNSMVKDFVDNVMKITKENNIPIYFYDNQENYFNERKDKSVSPYDVYDLRDDEMVDYFSSSYLYFIFRIVAMLQKSSNDYFDLIVKHFEFTPEEVKELKNRITSSYELQNQKLFKDELLRLISGDIHGIRSNTDDKFKFLLKLLANDMRRKKAKNLKEYYDMVFK